MQAMALRQSCLSPPIWSHRDCQASGSSQGILTLTGSSGALDKAAQYAFAHIQEWDICRLKHLQDGLTVVC